MDSKSEVSAGFVTAKSSKGGAKSVKSYIAPLETRVKKRLFKNPFNNAGAKEIVVLLWHGEKLNVRAAKASISDFAAFVVTMKREILTHRL